MTRCRGAGGPTPCRVRFGGGKPGTGQKRSDKPFLSFSVSRMAEARAPLPAARRVGFLEGTRAASGAPQGDG